MELHAAHQLPESGIAFQLLAGMALTFRGELEGQLVGGVVLQHIEDENLLDRLGACRA